MERRASGWKGSFLFFKFYLSFMFHCFQSDPVSLSTKDNGTSLKGTLSNTQVASRKSPGLKTILYPKKLIMTLVMRYYYSYH